MRGLLCLFSLFVGLLPAFAQPTPAVWSVAYGTHQIEVAYGLTSLSGDRLLAVGWGFGESSTELTPCVLKLGPDGDSLAMRQYEAYPGCYLRGSLGRPNDGCWLYGVVATDTAHDDVMVLELDSSGTVEHIYTAGSAGYDIPAAAVPTADDGYLVAGSHYATVASNVNVMLMKLAANGTLEWQRTYGGPGLDLAHALQPTLDGNYVLAGVTGSFGAGQRDAYVLKVTPAGDTLWTRTFGGAGNDEFRALTALEDGSLVCAGGTDSAGYARVYVVKLTADGTLLWEHRLGEASGHLAYATTLIPVTQGGFALAGNALVGSDCDGILLRLDAAGHELWRCRYQRNVSDYFYALRQLADGSFVMAGSTTEHFYVDGELHMSDDFWVVRTGPDPILDVPVPTATLPTTFALSAYPNPFNATTTLALDLPRSGPVRVVLVDALGRQAQTFDFPSLTAGRHELRVDGAHLATGIYYAQVTAEAFTATQKLVLLK